MVGLGRTADTPAKHEMGDAMTAHTYRRNYRSARLRLAGFSLTELLIAAAISLAMMTAVMMVTVHMRWSFEATEIFSKSQADQIRLIDSVSRDLRNAVSVGINSTDNPVTEDSVNQSNTIGGGTLLVLQVPNRFKSNDPAAAAYRQAQTLYADEDARVWYGDASGSSGYLTVTYRKEARGGGLPGYQYVRSENGIEEVIATDERNRMDLDVSLVSDGSTAGNNRVFVTECWFAGPFRWPPWDKTTNARVTSSDRILLRNPRIDL